MYFWSCTNVIPTLALALLLDVRCNTAEAEDHIAADLGTLRPERAPLVEATRRLGFGYFRDFSWRRPNLVSSASLPFPRGVDHTSSP